jgi:hypothetical protein
MQRRVGVMLSRVICAIAFSAMAVAGARAQVQGVPTELHGKVLDENGHPVARVEVTARWGADKSTTVYTDASGEFRIAPIEADKVSLLFAKPGYFKLESNAAELKPGVNEATFTLPHETAVQVKVEVYSNATQLDPTITSHQDTVVQHQIIATPVASSYDLQQSLITIPNVLKDSGGRIHIAGARQGQTEILLDGFEINDPANGSFTPRLNVDAVQWATVETGGYGGQYAHAAAGVLILDTISGDDKWRFGLVNFIPGANIERGVHFGAWFPRFIVSGPIQKGRAWFSIASSLQHSYNIVDELPEGQDVSTEWAGDTLLRTQVNITPKNILQGSFLYVRSSIPESGLGPFSPLSTTTNAQAERYFVSLKDQFWVGKSLVEIGVAGDTGGRTNTPQGNAPYVITPDFSSGNYFQRLEQDPRRIQFLGNMTTDSIQFMGTHTITAGLNADALSLNQRATRSQIDYQRSNGTLSERAMFLGPANFTLSNTQFGAYVQDMWRPVKPVVISAGVRLDWDSLVERVLVEPQFALNWIPAADGRMKFTLSWGEHYQPVNLSLLGQANDQARSSVFYDATGVVPLGPAIVSGFLLPNEGLFQPRSYNTMVEWNQRIREGTFVGAAYLLRQGERNFAWEFQPSGSFLLQDDRRDRFQSVEVWVRSEFGKHGEFLVDYTRSSTTSNQVLDPTLFSLVLSPQQPGPLLWDAPNRLLSRGWAQLPVWKLLGSYFFEYHSGFPYTAVNERRQLVGPANGQRFPSYLSLNAGLEREFHFRNRVWAIRLSANNITNHGNPDSVVNDVDAPTFGKFSGGHGRSYTARLRLVTAH